jgi:hypothetical protein
MVAMPAIGFKNNTNGKYLNKIPLQPARQENEVIQNFLRPKPPSFVIMTRTRNEK